MARKHERQTGVVMNDLARLDQVDAKQFLGKVMCPWNCGEKALPEQVNGRTHYWLWIGCSRNW